MKNNPLVINGTVVTPQMIALINELKSHMIEGGNSMKRFKNNLFALQNITLHLSDDELDTEQRIEVAESLYYMHEFADKLDDLIETDQV
jgi:hypothetical protein